MTKTKRNSVRRLLIITDNYHVSALLFHGLGLPPWHDLPAIQTDPAWRRSMTETVNKTINQAQADGFTAFDVHEAFPVHFMDMDESAEIIRNVDYFMLERKYHAVQFLHRRFRGLPRQPRLGMIKSMRLGNTALTETGILALYFKHHGIKILAPEPKEARVLLEKRVRFPADFTIEFDARLKLKDAAGYPGMVNTKPHAFTARVRDAEQLLEFYRYAGLQIINKNI